MSELDKLNKKRLALVKKLEAVRAEIRPKAIEFGTLAQTHKSDPAYSAAWFDNLQKDLDRLREQEGDLCFDLEQVELEIQLESAPKPDPAAVKQQKERDSRRLALESDLARLQVDLESRRAGLGAAIVAGGDPGALMDELNRLELQESGLLAGLAALKRD